MLIDCSYFATGPRHILNATMGTMPNPNAREVQTAIESYIREYQEIFLILMLGSKVGKRVHGYLEWEEGEVPDTDNEIDEICEMLKEPFADYVFYHIIGENATQATATGLVRLKCANEYVSPIRRQVKAWNRMVERNRQFIRWVSEGGCPFKGVTTSMSMVEYINIFNI